MTDNKKNDPATTRIIGLGQVQARFGIDPEVLHRQAIAGEVELCAWIPEGCSAFNVDPASLQIAHPSYLLPMSEFEHRFPRQFEGVPTHARVRTHLVTISRLACREIFPQPILKSPDAEHGKAPLAPSIPTGRYAYPQTTQTIFRSAYGLADGICDEADPNFVRVNPQRPVLDFMPTPDDESQWCFAIYPSDTNFSVGEIDFRFPGYQAPLDLLLSASSLCISEAEVIRVMSRKSTRLLGLFPEDSRGSADAELPSVIKAPTDAEIIFGEVSDKGKSKARANAGNSNSVESVEFVVVHSERTPPTRFLSIDEVASRFKRAPQTIYDWIKPTSPRYKPDFPTQVPLGNGSVGWVEAEIERYAQSLVARRSEPQKKSIPKRNSKKKKDGEG